MTSLKSQVNFAHIHSVAISWTDFYSLMQISIKVVMHLNNESRSNEERVKKTSCFHAEEDAKISVGTYNTVVAIQNTPCF